MVFLLSVALTGLAVSPVFVLAGWMQGRSPIYLHERFNNLTFQRF